MSFEDVVSIYKKFNSGNRESFFEAEKLRNQLIFQKDKIWILLQNINNQEIDPQMQLFIINLINDIIKHNFNSLPLYELNELLCYILNQAITNQENLNANVINSIYDLIGLFKFIIYITDNRFCFDINISNHENYEQNQHFEILAFLKYLISPPKFLIEIFKEKQYITLFINNQFKPLLSFLYHYIANDSIEPILNITQLSIILCKQDKKKIKFDTEINEIFLAILQNKSLNDKLNKILINCENFVSASIIDLLSNSLNFLFFNDSYLNQEIYENIFNSLILIINNPQKFFNEDVVTTSFCNFMLSIPIGKTILSRCEKFGSCFFQFIHQALHCNYYLAIRILSSSIDFLYNIYDYIPEGSPFYSSYASLFESFVRATNESIENDPVLLFNSLFYGKNEMKMTRKIVISLLQASENIIDKDVNLIIDYFKMIVHSEFHFTLHFDVKESFAIFVSSLIIKYEFDENVKTDVNLSNLLFIEFVESLGRIKEYKINENVAPLYASESLIISFLEMFVKKHIYNSSSKGIFPIIPLTSFNGYNTTVIFIFSRLWEDIINEIHLAKAANVLSLLLHSNKVVEILTTTQYLQGFFDNYLSFPQKSIVYTTIAKVAYANSAHIPFIQKVYSDLFQKIDETSTKILYKILSSFFQNAPSSQTWREIYFSYQTNFSIESDAISKIPNKILHKILLKFLLILIQSAPKAEFKTIEPYSFQLFISVIQLLTNLLNSLIEELKNQQNAVSELDDEQWSNVELITQAFGIILKSNLTNYGIMKFYNDQSVFNLFSILFMIISKFSYLNFFTRPQLNLNISMLLSSLACYFKEEMVKSDQFWQFFIATSKIILMSNYSESINTICKTLCSLLTEHSDSFRNHFILAIDALTKKDDLYMAVEFLIQFNKTDEKFVFEVGQLIENSLNDPNAKFDFDKKYNLIWKFIENNENKLEHNKIVQKIYQKICDLRIIWHSLPCLEKCFSI